MLRECAWPGNVRESQNLLHKTVIMDDGGVVTPDALGLQPNLIILSPEQLEYADDPYNLGNKGLPEDIRPLWLQEKRVIEHAVRVSGEDIIETAKHLGVSGSTIYRKRKQWATLLNNS